MEIKRTDDNGSAADFSSLFFKHALGKMAEAKVLSGNPNWLTVSCYSPTFLYSLPLPPFFSHFAHFPRYIYVFIYFYRRKEQKARFLVES